jgi:WD40 repeat protein
MAFSPDAQWLAVATEAALYLVKRTNATNRWARTARVALDVGAGEPAALAFSPDSRALVVAYNRFDLRLYDVATARELATFIAPNAAAIVGFNSTSFSPDGRLLRAVRGNGEVIEWDIPVVRAGLAKVGLAWSDTPGALSSLPSLRRESSVPAQNYQASRLPAAFAAGVRRLRVGR